VGAGSPDLNRYYAASSERSDQRLLAVQVYFAAATNFRNLGEEPLDSVRTAHVSGDIDAGRLLAYIVSISNNKLAPITLPNLPALGTVEVWVDPERQIIRRLLVTVNSSGFDQFIGGQMPPGFGTPAPGGAAPTPITALTYTTDVTITRPNEPAIRIPTP
jgi:hypothetical protein